MFKRLLQRFYNQSQGKELVLIGACYKATDDNYWLYDEAEQALEYLYYWYGQTEKSNSARMVNGGYFSIVSTHVVEMVNFFRYVQSLRKHQALPVIFSNSCQGFAECVADYQCGKVGIVNLNQQLDLSCEASFVPMQGYKSIKSDKEDVDMLSLGVYEPTVSQAELSLAEAMGVSWFSSARFSNQFKDEMFSVLECFMTDQQSIALNIDLRSVVRGMTIQPPFALDFDLVMAVVEKLMCSNKVLLVNITGDSESLIFSSEAKKILDIVRLKRD